AEVDHQDRCRARDVFRLVYLEIACAEANRRPRSTPLNGVHDGLGQVQQERIAEFVWLAAADSLARPAAVVELMLADLVLGELLENVVQRLLANLADTLRRELVSLPVLADITRV